MTDSLKMQIDSFFESYPDSLVLYEVAGQLFHANAKDAAEGRAKYYGLKVEEHKNTKIKTRLVVN